MQSDAEGSGNKKVCSKCKVEKSAEDDFYRDSKASDGRASQCKVCSRIGKRKKPQNDLDLTRPEKPKPPPIVSEANRRAIKKLILNHEREFRHLVVEERKRLGVMKQWRPAHEVAAHDEDRLSLVR